MYNVHPGMFCQSVMNSARAATTVSGTVVSQGRGFGKPEFKEYVLMYEKNLQELLKYNIVSELLCRSCLF